MVGDAVLGVVVGADFLGAVGAAHLGLAAAADLRVVAFLLGLEEAGPQHGHGLLLVLVLGALVLADDHYSGGLVDDADGGGDLVDVLSAVSAGMEDVDAQLVGIHPDFDFVGFG